MNNSKIWLVVHPTVGVPLFLSAVAIGSFSVHVAVLTNTSWVSDFLSGKELGSGDAAASMMLDKSDTNLAMVTPSAGEQSVGPKEFTVILPDGTKARAVIESPTSLASLGTATRVPPDR